MTSAARIKRARLEKKLSHKKLAELCGIPAATIRRFEKGAVLPNLASLRRLAAAMEIPWTELLPEEPKIRAFREAIRTGSYRRTPLETLNEAEKYRAGVLHFPSDRERAFHFYAYLNDKGRLAAASCLFRHIGDDAWEALADALMLLSEQTEYMPEDVLRRIAAASPQRPGRLIRVTSLDEEEEQEQKKDPT